MEDKHLFRFGEFELCVEERSLRRGHDNIALTPKMYELLLVLVQNPNKIIEKEFLLKTVWPDSFVEEGNITFNIRQLRKALEDSAQEPIYIETIPRRGYRFAAKVERHARRDHDTVDASVTTDRGAADPAFWLRSRPTLATLTFVMLAALMGSAVWLSRGSAGGVPILTAPFATEKLSTDGRVTHAVITPDGKSIVYSHIDGKKQSMWLRQLETSNNVQIVPPSDEHYGGLAMSADGNTVYATRVSTPLGIRPFDIYRVPLVGGAPQKVVTGSQGWISVSPQGDHLSFVRCNYKNDDYCSLWVANAADGSNERRLVSRTRPVRIADNKISPDGRTVAFAVGQSSTGSNDFSFMEVDVETGVERELTSQKFFNINYIEWLPDGGGWLITAQILPDKNYRIWLIPASGGEPTRLTSDAETYSRLSLDAKGRTLVATRVEQDFKLNLYQTDLGGASPRLISDGGSVDIASDQKIYYSTTMTGDPEIWSVNADGTGQRQLTNNPGTDIAPLVSPDNRTIFFSSNRSGAMHVWRMGPDGSDQVAVTSEEGGFPLRISPDGQWLYYRSGLQSTLRRVSLLDGQEELVYNYPAADFSVSPDTSRIVQFRQKNGEYTFEILSLANKEIERRFKPPLEAGNPIFVSWSPDGKDIVYILDDEARENRSLWFQGAADGDPRKIADLGSTEIFELASFALAHDANSFVVSQGSWNHNAVLIKGLKP